MDFLINVVLPLSLAVIMLSLGIGLTAADFKRVFTNGWAFVIGALAQMVLVPAVAYLTILMFGITGELAAGIMLLSFCPGGVTSNIFAKFGRADVALSVSLTATISLLSILTVPFLVAWAVVHFMGAHAPEISITTLATAVFLITTVPVAIGVSIRSFAPTFADRVEPVLSVLAAVLFALIVIAAVAGNWTFFIENLTKLGPALIGMNAVLMLLGLGLAMLAGLGFLAAKTISVEVGIQNGTLGITLAPLIVGVTEGFSVLSLPSAIYGVTMYLVALPFIIWFRRV